MPKATSERAVRLLLPPQSDVKRTTATAALMPTVKRIGFIGAQIALLLLLNTAGTALVAGLGLPFPGTVAGLVLLFGALVSGVIPLAWVEEAAGLLTRHLAFFFIPIAVGLMTFGELLFANGAALLIALALSAAIGIGVTGGTAQMLSRKARSGAPR